MALFVNTLLSTDRNIMLDLKWELEHLWLFRVFTPLSQARGNLLVLVSKFVKPGGELRHAIDS